MVVINVVIGVMIVFVVCVNVLVIHIYVYASAMTIIRREMTPVVRRMPHAVTWSVEHIIDYRHMYISGAQHIRRTIEIRVANDGNRVG